MHAEHKTKTEQEVKAKTEKTAVRILHAATK